MKPETRNQKPETRNQKPETRKQKPESRNQKAGAVTSIALPALGMVPWGGKAGQLLLTSSGVALAVMHRSCGRCICSNTWPRRICVSATNRGFRR
jgi:hypothetical protein